MYITITPQKRGPKQTKSVSDFVAYLEKEDVGKALEDREPFFNQYDDHISRKEVIREIDANTAKLIKTAPKFYTITLNPSQQELKHLTNHSEALKEYTKAVMKAYVLSFNRDIQGRPIHVNDIMYYAKIEHERSYKWNDKAIRDNAPYHEKIKALHHDIQQIKQGHAMGSIQEKEDQIKQLDSEAPHRRHGKMITQGMAKEGLQSHIHIIVSRTDRSNRYSLSPGSPFKASEGVLNGKTVKRGFNRETFFKNSESTFDAVFAYKRHYVESYQARKTLLKEPQTYYAHILGLPEHEKATALKLMGRSSLRVPLPNIPTSKVQLAFKAIQLIKKGMGKAIESGSIEI